MLTSSMVLGYRLTRVLLLCVCLLRVQGLPHLHPADVALRTHANSGLLDPFTNDLRLQLRGGSAEPGGDPRDVAFDDETAPIASSPPNAPPQFSAFPSGTDVVRSDQDVVLTGSESLARKHLERNVPESVDAEGFDPGGRVRTSSGRSETPGGHRRLLGRSHSTRDALSPGSPAVKERTFASFGSAASPTRVGRYPLKEIPPAPPMPSMGLDGRSLESISPTSIKIHKPSRVSTILEKFINENGGYSDEQVKLAEVMAMLGPSAVPILLFLLSVPIFLGLPGIGIFLGLALVYLSYSLAIGSYQPVLPDSIKELQFRRTWLVKMFNTILPVLKVAEKILRPRWRFITNPVTERLLGMFLVQLCCVITLPIPLSTQPPAACLAVIALGLVEKDGLFVVVGFVLAVVAELAVAAVVFSISNIAWNWMRSRTLFGHLSLRSRDFDPSKGTWE